MARRSDARNRPRTAALVSLLVALTMGLVGCSSGPPVSEQAGQEVAALGDALAEAVILSYQASQGRAEADAGTAAVNDARTLTLQLSETSASLAGEAQALSLGLVELANRAIVWVGQSEYERAEKLRLEEFIPLAAQFETALAGPAVEPVAVASSAPLSTGQAVAILSGIAAVGLLVYARYRRGDIPDPVVEARKRKAERSGHVEPPKERKWSDITTFVETPIEEIPSEGEDVGRSTRARTMEVDLRELLMTALHQIKDYGWDMSIVCPELKIMADPVKLRHAVLAALGNAFLGGARRAGIIVEDLEGDVVLTIGRDAPPSSEDAEGFANRFANQVSLALGESDHEWSFIADEEVSMMSVSLGRKVGADEVSEPVA